MTIQLAFLSKVGYFEVVSEKICDRRRLTLPVGCAPLSGDTLAEL